MQTFRGDGSISSNKKMKLNIKEVKGEKRRNSKQKGKRGERYVVNAFKDEGFECNRTAQFKGNTRKSR